MQRTDKMSKMAKSLPKTMLLTSTVNCKNCSLVCVSLSTTVTQNTELSLLPQPQPRTVSRQQTALQHLWLCSESHRRRDYSCVPDTNCTNAWLHFLLLDILWYISFWTYPTLMKTLLIT